MAEINDEMDTRLSASVSELLTKADLLIDDYNTSLLNVKSSISTISSDIGNINQEITDIDGNISTITSTVESANTAIDNINTTVTDINNEIANVNTTVSGINTEVGNVKNDITSLADKVLSKECKPVSEEDLGYNANALTDTGIYCISSTVPLVNYPPNIEFPAIMVVKSVPVIYKGEDKRMVTQEIRPLMRLDKIAQRVGLVDANNIQWAIWRFTPITVDNIYTDKSYNVTLGVRSVALGGTGASTPQKALSNLGALKLQRIRLSDFNLVVEPGWYYLSKDSTIGYVPLENSPSTASSYYYMLVLEVNEGGTEIQQFALSVSGELFTRRSFFVNEERYFIDWIKFGPEV